jgi:hypothetical protein
VGQDPHRARQDEQPASQLRREPEFGVGDGGRAVDVHRDRRGPSSRQLTFEFLGNDQVVPLERAGRDLLGHRPQQGIATGIARMKPVPEAGNVGSSLPEVRQRLGDRGFHTALFGCSAELGEHCHALLPGPAVHVAEQSDAGGHRTVQPDAAGGRHAGGRDRRCLRTVVHGGDECLLQQSGLCLVR